MIRDWVTTDITPGSHLPRVEGERMRVGCSSDFAASSECRPHSRPSGILPEGNREKSEGLEGSGDEHSTDHALV